MSKLKYPKYHRGLMMTSSDPNDYTCHVCSKKDSKPAEAHLKGKTHRRMAKYFNKYFEGDGPSIKCKICKESCALDEILEHAESHRLIPWHRPDNEFEVLFRNFVSCLDHEYFCHLCNMKCSKWYLAISHTECEEHRSNLNALTDESGIKKVSLSGTICQVGVEHAIFRGRDRKLFCHLCSCSIKNVHQDLLKHAKDRAHKKNEKRVKQKNKQAKSFRLSPERELPDEDSDRDLSVAACRCEICQAEVDIDELEHHLTLHEKNPYKSNSHGIVNVLEIPKDSTVKLSHAPDKKSVGGTNNPSSTEINNNVETKISMNNNVVKEEFTSIGHPTLPDGFTIVDNSILCELCTLKLGKSMAVQKHLASKNHKLRQEAYAEGVIRKSKIKYECTWCNTPLVGLKVLKEHLASFQHSSNDPKILEQIELKKGSVIVPQRIKGQASVATYASVVSQKSRNVQREEYDSNKVSIGLDRAIQPSDKFVSNGMFDSREIQFVICNICQCFVLADLYSISHHIASFRHSNNLRGDRRTACEPILVPYKDFKYTAFPSDAPADENLIKVIVRPLNDNHKVLDTFHWCKICGGAICDPPSSHSQSEIHTFRLHGIVPSEDERLLFCLHCDSIIVLSLDDFMNHINGPTHQWKLQNYEWTVERKIITEPLAALKIHGVNKFHCILCNIENEGNVVSGLLHTIDKSHKSLVNVIELNHQEESFYCKVCKRKIMQFSNITPHLNGVIHVKKVRAAAARSHTEFR